MARERGLGLSEVLMSNVYRQVIFILTHVELALSASIKPNDRCKMGGKTGHNVALDMKHNCHLTGGINLWLVTTADRRVCNNVACPGAG